MFNVKGKMLHSYGLKYRYYLGFPCEAWYLRGQETSLNRRHAMTQQKISRFLTQRINLWKEN